VIRKKASQQHVTVTFAVPDAGMPVSVVADFNGWDPLAHPMRKRSNGTRSVSVRLEKGTRAAFRYLDAEGRFFDDPDGDGTEPNGYGEVHTLVDV
jgi:1,4-alpha-glucan branching enzyme